ncbi:MAG: cytochrome c family protein [Planctomycetes bacterium]|nr:cytochrome c family protein [Planctomycetota bacterium]
MKQITPLPLLLTALLTATAIATLVQCGERQDPGAAVARTPASHPPQDPQPAIPVGVDFVRLCVSGNLNGRLEPCGCASGQLGGLGRRMFHVGQSPGYDLLLEGGNLVEGGSAIDLHKFFAAAEVLLMMRTAYDAIGVGAQDLELPYADWSGLLSAYQQGSDGKKHPRVVASDLDSKDPSFPAVPFVEKKVRDHTIRIGSLTGRIPDTLRQEPAQVTVLEPAAAWTRALAGADPATLRVLMVHDVAEVARKLAPTLNPPPDLLVCMDGGVSEPPAQPEFVGTVPIVYPGIRGRVLLELKLARIDGKARVSYFPIPLAGSQTKPGAQEDPDVRAVLMNHRQTVKDEKVLAAMAGTRPTATGASYVGSEACQACHADDYTKWQPTRHAKAWATLEEAETNAARYGWPVTHYPDCVSCHVVGYREVGGFKTFADTPDLVAVGCERCHGPASEHVRTNGTTRLGKVGGGLPSTVCTECHDLDQSPDFDYLRKWALIEHGKK